jgi:hypothetical protein
MNRAPSDPVGLAHAWRTCCRLLPILLASLAATGMAAALPTNCAGTPVPALELSLALGLQPRSPSPGGWNGSAFVEIPLSSSGSACTQGGLRMPADVLRGEPGDVLTGPASPDLLRGRGEPRVRIEGSDGNDPVTP